jgi:hypothetical protein
MILMLVVRVQANHVGELFAALFWFIVTMNSALGASEVWMKSSKVPDISEEDLTEKLHKKDIDSKVELHHHHVI